VGLKPPIQKGPRYGASMFLCCPAPIPVNTAATAITKPSADRQRSDHCRLGQVALRILGFLGGRKIPPSPIIGRRKYMQLRRQFPRKAMGRKRSRAPVAGVDVMAPSTNDESTPKPSLSTNPSVETALSLMPMHGAAVMIKAREEEGRKLKPDYHATILWPLAIAWLTAGRLRADDSR